MALRPEDRYAIARALADDIERWMADEPVTAWREPFSRRARRWARRNRTAVTPRPRPCWWRWPARRPCWPCRPGPTATCAGQPQTLRERDLARQNFDLARRAVDDYLTRVGQNPLLKEQGLHDLRQELLEAALGYYRDFLRQRGDDPRLTAEAAAAHERVGDILIELGRFGDALAALRRALALIEPLVRERPGDPPGHRTVRLLAGRLQALHRRRPVSRGDRRLRPGAASWR